MSTKNIYLISSGTSVNDIINSINNIKQELKKKDNSKKDTTFLSFFSGLFQKPSEKPKEEQKNNIKKIEDEQFSKLDTVGIYEANMCKNNENNKLLLDGITNIYTSLDLNSIETGFILFNEGNNISFTPLPYMSNKTSIKDQNSYDKFKNILVHSSQLKNIKTKLNNYWTSQKLSNNSYYNIKKINGILNWKYLNNMKSNQLNTYNLYNFEKLLINILNTDTNTDNFIFVCNSKMILDLLNKFSKKFNTKSSIIENTSIWRLSIETKKNPDRIIYKNYDKIYPTDYNPTDKVLFERNNGNSSYLYNDTIFTLFNTFSNISFKYLEKMDFKRFSSDVKSQILKNIKLYKQNNNTKSKNNKNKTISKNNININNIKLEGL